MWRFPEETNGVPRRGLDAEERAGRKEADSPVLIEKVS